MSQDTEVASWNGLEIAIIGMAGRFPGARDLAAFWHNLRNGVESITFFTDQELTAAGIDPALLRDPNYVKAQGVLPDSAWFDAAFFGFSPREAEMMDPQHRLFLECAWEALEHAGYGADTDAGTVGVYAGASLGNYALHLLANPEYIRLIGSTPVVLGNDKDYLCTRVSYKLNLQGPSLTVQTSCSTSLVAVHLACQGLLSGACDMALAGGVSSSGPAGYVYQPGGIHSPDGHCRAFDAAARGTVSGCGVGIVVLKRLADAIAAGDHILAIVKGSAINNDGALKAGYTAPQVHGQAQVIRAAQRMAEISAANISYIETHGTGTALGDPIEVAALTQAFRASTAATGFCALGSVKTNIGHLDAAAGVAGLIKTVLALQHELLPPSLHFRQANPQIDFAASPFYVNTALAAWPAGATPRRAGVSSFGMGGTNAHVVLEEAPRLPASGPSRPWQLLLLSARSATALDTATARLVAHCQQHPEINLADLAYTLQVGRRAFDHRRMLVCQDVAEAVRDVGQAEWRMENGEWRMGALQHAAPGRVVTGVREVGERPVVFMFPGQGAQYVQMGAELYREEPRFREQVDGCAALLAPALGLDLRDLLYPQPGHSAKAAQRLAQTQFTQPALFVIEYALARLWMAWGVRPQAMLGHSIGEYVAACLAGVLSLEDALALVAARGRLMQQLPAGAMLAVALAEPEVQAFLGPRLSLAAHNGPAACVIAGPTPDVVHLEQRLQKAGVACRRLQTSHAFHSAMMEPILGAFLGQVAQVDFHPPTLPYVSNVTGTWITAAEATAASYWARHVRHPVRFAEGLQTVLQEPQCVLLEVGPGTTLGWLARRHPQVTDRSRVLESLPALQEYESEMAGVLRTLGQLWLAGVEIDWVGFSAHERRQRLPLPSYPFERQQYWITPATPQSRPLQSKLDLAEWFYLPSWQRSMLPHARVTPGEHWVVFADGCGLAAQIVRRLQEQGQEVTTVVVGERFARLSEAVYSLQPQCRDHYEALAQALSVSAKLPTRMVHCWSVTAGDPTPLTEAGFTLAQDTGFYSLLFLAQALGEQPRSESLHLVVVSSNLHDVTGAERLSPEKATLLGCCKVLPQEYPHLTCRNVDVVPAAAGTWQADRLVEQILAEIGTPLDDAVVAYRGNHRWVQTFTPIRLTAEDGMPTRLRDRGVYLITGGLGGLGLLLADYLARTVRARLVLISRTGLPPRAEWEPLTRTPSHFALAHAVDDLHRLEENLVETLNIKSMQHYDGLEESLNTLCASYIFNYFKENHVDTQIGTIYHKDELKDVLKILPKFAKFYEFMLHILNKDEIIKEDSEFIQFIKNESLSILKESINKKYPAFTGLFRLLEHCVRHYGPALRGDIEAISVLYPDGSTDLLREATSNTVEHDTRRIYLLLLKEMLTRIIQNSAPKTVRILEIGGGSGALTQVVLPGLEKYQVEYTFTDIGTSFVRRAEHEAARHGAHFMHFGILDITRDAEEQGYARHSFDCIVGLDIVHATRNIAETLGHLQNLLVPGGLLLLVETVKTQRWVEMIWGLAEGWWSFEDAPLRQDSPILNLDTWETVLRQQGFTSVATFPQPVARRQATDYGLIVAQPQAPGLAPQPQDRGAGGLREAQPLLQETIHKVRALEQAGAEVLVLRADVASLPDMQAAVQQAYERFGDLHGVIHTAAIAGGGLVQVKTPALARRELAPKVGGVLVLDALFRSARLDFLVLCSSLSSLIGGVGQVGYSAANAFLDAFAHYQAGRNGTCTVSINWDRWRGVGLAVAVEARHKALTGDDASTTGMTPGEGIEAFHRILSHPAVPQVLVSSEDFQAVLAQSRAAVPTLPAPPRLATAGHARPPLGQNYVAPRNTLEQRLADIWQEVFGIEPVGIHDDFFELGGESLIALQILSRLRAVWQVELSLRHFLEAPTIAGLAAALAQAGDRSAPAPPLVPLSREAHRSQRLV